MIQYDIMKTIVAATKNKHKIVEIEAILKDFGMHIITRDEAGVPGILKLKKTEQPLRKTLTSRRVK